MSGKIKKSLLLIIASLLILCVLPIYFVVNYQRNFNTQAQATGGAVDTTNLTEVDYFEYQNDGSDLDPFNNAIAINNSAFSSGTNQLFLRKGQKLLFDYKAITEASNNCGNITIKTTPRPAVLCRGNRDAIVPNPQCRDYVELCKFEGWTSSGLQTFYKIKEPKDVAESFCQSVVKVCLPIVDNVCRTRSAANGFIVSIDAIKCCDSAMPCTDLSTIASATSCPADKTTTIKTAQEILLPNICGGIDFYSAGSVSANVVKCCYSPSAGSTSATCATTNYGTCSAAGQKLVYSTSASGAGANFANCIGNANIITNIVNLEKDQTISPLWNGAASVAPSTTSCIDNLKHSSNNQPQAKIVAGENSDVCYDLSEYTGRAKDVVPQPDSNNVYGGITYEEYQGFLQNGKNAKPVSAIETLYADKPFGNLDYSNKNIITINENGQLANLPEFTVNNNSTMKMLFVNNVNFNQSFQSASDHPETQISFNQTQTYKNGEMLKVVLCQEDPDAYSEGERPRYQENYATKCDQYFMPDTNKKEVITKTYNSAASTSLAPNSLTDSDFLTIETPEAFVPNATINHQVGSIDITNTAINVYANSSQTNRSPYMFDKDGLLKFMVAQAGTRAPPPASQTDPRMPACHNYDNNVYCHQNFNRQFDSANLEGWEKDQLRHDLGFRLAFQIDDLDIKKEFPTAPPENNPSPSTYYPNSIPNETPPSIQKGNQAYQNNTGKYEVTVKVTNPAKKAQLAVMEKLDNIVDKLSLSDMLDFENPLGQKNDDLSSVSTATVSTSDGVFVYLATNKTLKGIVYYSAILMILLFGFMYLMGLSKLDHQTLAAMVLKIAFVFSLFSSDAWMLYQNIFAGPVIAGFNTISYATLQILSPQDLVTTANSGIYELDQAKISTYFYQSVDVITMILNQKNHFKIMAIFFSYSYGFVYVFIIYYGFYLYLFATANAILMFLLAKIIMLILINLLPLFLLCLFFKTTKKMLDNWFSLVLGYGFQQIFIIIAVAFFNIMIVYILKMILGYKICWDVILKIPQGSLGSGVPFADINIFKFWKVSDGETGDYIPSLFHILYFLILVYAMKHFINFASTLGSSIAGGVSVADLANSIKNDINNNVVSKIIRQRFNKLVGGMQNKLIDKISFGYSGKLADERIENKNQEIDQEREVFNSLQQKLNDYKSNNKDELLGKSDLEIRAKLEEKANAILEEEGYYGNYQDLIKRANQSKSSTSTTMPGMLADYGWQYGTKYFGKATNAATGNNWTSGLANDSGDISADNLFNSNLPRVTQEDIKRKAENIDEKIKTLQEELLTLDTKSQAADIELKQNEIQQLQMQKEIASQQKNTWDSMNKLREYRDKYGVEAMLIGAAGGVVGGAVGSFFGGLAGIFIGGAGGAAGGVAGGVTGGISVGSNVYNRIAGEDSRFTFKFLGFISGAGAGIVGGVVGGVAGVVAGGVAGVVAGGVRGGVRVGVRGAVSGIYGVGVVGVARAGIARARADIARAGVGGALGSFVLGSLKEPLQFTSSNFKEVYQPTSSNTSSGIVAVDYGFSRFLGAVNYGFRSPSVVARTFVSGGGAVVGGVAGGVGGAIAGALGGTVVDTILEEKSAYEANKEYYGMAFAAVYSSIAFVPRFLFNLPRNTIAGFITGAKAGFKKDFSNISQDYQQNKAAVVNAYSSAYNIATDDAQYNLRETLTRNQIGEAEQKNIIEEFKEKIRPFLSKKTDLSQLDFSSLGQDYSDPNLQKIHKIIKDTLAKDSLQNISNKSTLLFQLIKLADAEKPVSDINSAKSVPGKLLASTAGAALVGVGYGFGSADQTIRNSIQNHREKQAEQKINELINSLGEIEKQNVKEVFTEEFKKSLKNSNITGVITLIKTVTQKVENVTNKANLKTALEKYAQQLQKS